jgi:ATP-binding cassette subfamily B protein RaxB
MIAGYHGHRIDLGTLRRRYPPSQRGATLTDLLGTAASLHLSGRALRLGLAQLRELRAPCLLHWEFNHFVVLVHASRRHVVVHDPALGRRSYPPSEVSVRFTGVALELMPTSEFTPLDEVRRLRIRDLWTRMDGLRGSFGLVLTLSALLQLCVLAGPLYTQLAVDHVLRTADRDLLLVLALGFGLVVLLRAAIALLRDYTLLYASQLLSFQMASNVVSHLLRLPLAYFERRHLGDVLSRVRSLQPIEELITKGVAETLLDGVLAFSVVAMMLTYSPWLTALACSIALAFAALRVVLYRPIRRINEQHLVASAREETATIEMLRGIQAVKLLGVEPSREALWQNRRADTINADVRATRWELGFSAASTLLFGLEHLLVIYLASRLVLDQQFSVGMLYAYISFKMQFSERCNALIDWAVRYRMLDVHLGRLADIVHTREERGLRGAPNGSASLKGRIELRNVSFRYSDRDPFVLRDVSLEIEEGACVALVGRSGSGKTTLIKLILGVLEPTDGEILIDGRRLGDEDRSGYRRQTASVMQEDHFFEGTIADNISAFDPEQELAQVERAARAAFVHDEIAAMPMGYSSWIGNMGSNLSGGQRQRILLARAFYRQPRLLVLDEGTANLDPVLLDAVVGSLGCMSITRIFATHQAALLPLADQRWVVEEGGVFAFSSETSLREMEERRPDG